jgi:hypothetical protein
MTFLGCLILGLCPTSLLNIIEAPLLMLVTVGQAADRLAFPHAGLGQVQLDLATESCVSCPALW